MEVWLLDVVQCAPGIVRHSAAASRRRALAQEPYHLATLLGSCATISSDQRGNTLILTGTPACLHPAQGTH